MSLEDIINALPSKNAGQSSMVEIGKIKLGGKDAMERTSANGTKWRAPVKFDHFVITTLNRDARGDLIKDQALMDQLIASHGDADGKLRRIPIRLLSDDLDDIIQSAFVWYGNRSVGARSDGKRVTWFHDPKTMSRLVPTIEDDWTPEHLEMKSSRGVPLFKAHSVFNCVIAAQEARWGGVYKLRTTSVISLRQLHGSLVHLLQLTGGTLVGMPLELVMRPMQVSPEGKATTVYVVHVELRGGDLVELQTRALDMAKFRLRFADQIQTTQRQYKKLLALPGGESEDEIRDIVDEFAPEETVPLVNTVPEGKACSFLDEPQIATSPAKEVSPTKNPHEDAVKEPRTVPAETSPATDAGRCATWDGFVKLLDDLASEKNMDMDKVGNWLTKQMLRAGIKGKPDKAPLEWKLKTVKLMRDAPMAVE